MGLFDDVTARVKNSKFMEPVQMLHIDSKVVTEVEQYRLERKYARRPSAFASDARYVNGEYIYGSTQSTKPEKMDVTVKVKGAIERLKCM